MFGDQLLIDTCFSVNAAISLLGIRITASIVSTALRPVTSTLEELNGVRGSERRRHQLPAFVAVFLLVFPPRFPVGNKLDFQM